MSTVTGQGEAVPTRAEGSRVPQLIGWCSVLIGLIGAVWIWQHRPVRPPYSERRFSSADRAGFSGFQGDRFRPPMYMITGGWGGFGTHDGRVRLPQRAPRYLANLAAQAGDYVVSVRQVMGSDNASGRNLYANRPPDAIRGPLERMSLSLQVMSPKEEAVANVSDFAAHLVATDDKGRRLASVSNFSMVDFPRGKARVVEMETPAPDAQYLKTLEGEIILRKYGSTKPESRTFRIENVPLPVTNHVFGVVSAAYVDASHLTAAPSGPALSNTAISSRLLTGKDADLFRDSFPPARPEPNPLGLPSRVVLRPELENRLRLYTASSEGKTPDVWECSLKPRVGLDGEIPLTLELKQGQNTMPLRAEVSVWENEPALVLLSARDHKGRSLAVWLQLYLDAPPDEEDSSPLPQRPVPAGQGERGAAMHGQIAFEGVPLRYGRAALEVLHWDATANAWNKPVLAKVMLDQDGAWNFANLSPGRYRVRIVSAQPYRSGMSPNGRDADFLRRRYGMTSPLWQNETQEMTVRAGAFAELQLCNLTDSKRLASARPLPLNEK